MIVLNHQPKLIPITFLMINCLIVIKYGHVFFYSGTFYENSVVSPSIGNIAVSGAEFWKPCTLHDLHYFVYLRLVNTNNVFASVFPTMPPRLWNKCAG